jgi:hypothetical protein
MKSKLTVSQMLNFDMGQFDKTFTLLFTRLTDKLECFYILHISTLVENLEILIVLTIT